jgi:Family of unknown function (DUF5681)
MCVRIADRLGSRAHRAEEPPDASKFREGQSGNPKGRRKGARNSVMRFNAQIATIENGFVYLPSAVQWLAEFVPEILTFPGSKYDDQADSTSQALAWLNSQPPNPASLVTIVANTR